jgi:hypothetical protein
MYVKMHIIFVTLTHRYWGEELKGRLMTKRREKKSFFFQLHLSHSFACITPFAFNNDMKYWQTTALSLFFFIAYAIYCMHIFDCLFLVRLNDFEYHRRLPLWIERKANKQHWIPITVRERRHFTILFFSRAIICSPTHFSHNCNKSSPSFFLMFLSFSDLWFRI